MKFTQEEFVQYSKYKAKRLKLVNELEAFKRQQLRDLDAEYSAGELVKFRKINDGVSYRLIFGLFGFMFGLLPVMSIIISLTSGLGSQLDVKFSIISFIIGVALITFSILNFRALIKEDRIICNLVDEEMEALKEN